MYRVCTHTEGIVMAGPAALKIELTDDERAELLRWTRRRKTSQALATRARIVLAAAQGLNNAQICTKLGLCRPTVITWRRRFAERRLEGLDDEPRSGTPRTVSDEQVHEVVTRTLETKPRDATHWSTRTLAEELGLSQSTVSRIWRAFNLQPHRAGTFKLSTDPLFVDKVRDVVGLYMSPPDKAIVLCIDEKSQVQALDRTQPVLPMRPGSPERHTHEYVRHGTTSLFAALDIKTGVVIGECHRKHRHQEFIQFLNSVDEVVRETAEPGVSVHIVMDNYATHKTPAVKRWFARRPRYHMHFTPTGASWLNQVERFFSEITTRRIRRGVFRSVRSLEKAIRDYIDTRNEDARPFAWTADADNILRRVKNVCKDTSDSGH